MEEATTSRLRRGARTLLRTGAAILAALLVAMSLAAAIGFALSRGWQRERLTRELEAQLAAALGVPVQIGRLSGPLAPRLTAHDVRLGPEGDELAQAERIALRWDPPALLEGRLVVERLEIEGLVLSLRSADTMARQIPARTATAGAERRLAVELRAVRVARSRASVAWRRAAGPASLAGTFEGSLREVRLPRRGEARWGAARLSLELDPGDLGGARLERGVLEADLDAQHRLRLRALAAGSFGQIRLAGRGDLDAWLAARSDPATRVDLDFDALDLAALLGGDAPRSRLAGRAELRAGAHPGHGGVPELLCDVLLQPSELERVALSRGRLRASLLDRSWRIDALELEGEGVEVSGSGSGSGGELEKAQLHARVEQLDRLSSWLGEGSPEGRAELAGTLSLDAILAGPVGRASGSVALVGSGLAWRDLALGSLDARADVRDLESVRLERLALHGGLLSLEVEPGAVLRRAGSRLSQGVVIEGLRVRSEGATLSVDGGLDTDEVRDLRLRVDGLSPARLAAFQHVVQPSAGQLAADLVLDGPLASPRARGWIELRGGALLVPALATTFAPIEGRVRLEDESLVVERFAVGPPAERAEVSGRIALAGLRPGPADLRIALRDFPLTRVPLPGLGEEAAPAAETPVETGGRVDAELRLTGALLAPRIEGDLDWSRPRWAGVQLERITLHVAGDGDLLRAALRMRYGGREILSAWATLPIPAEPRHPIEWLHDERARVEASGDSLDLALLAPFLTRRVREPRGSANLHLVIEGARPQPHVDGVLTVTGGSIRVPLLRQTFAPVSATARFDGQRLSLEELSIGSPEAGLRATGALELADLLPRHVDLEVELRSFPLSRSSLLQTDVDGELALAGPVEAPSLTGELALSRTRLSVSSSRDPAYREVRVLTAGGEGSLRERPVAGPGLLDRASVDVQLRIPGDTWIRSPEIDLDVEGWARLAKRSLEPVRISGELTTRRGTVEVVTKRFAVRKGRAMLDGAPEPDPALDVEAVHTVADVAIIAHVTGRLSEPMLRLESDPEMDDEEIVSYLFFGRPANQLGASEQGGVNLAAANIAAGMALEELREIFGRSFPVDTIDLSIQEGEEPSRVEIGKYVAKDVFVRYGHTFGSEPVEELGVSYRIGPHWRIESTTSSNATAGADIIWTLDY